MKRLMNKNGYINRYVNLLKHGKEKNKMTITKIHKINLKRHLKKIFVKIY
jgi:hypothetical protein